MNINLSQLREYIENAQLALKTVNDIEKLERLRSFIKFAETLRQQLPERGTVIIDSNGMTVVPFEVGDDVYHIDSESSVDRGRDGNI